MTNDAELQLFVAAEFLALADLLDAVSDAQWNTPSLCAGWRVREVVAHMTMAARYSEEEFMAELRRCDFDFSRLSNQIAARDAELPTSELVASLRSDVMHHWEPPGGHPRRHRWPECNVVAIGFQSHSVFIAGAAWMQTSLAGPGPLLLKPCGTPAGPMTMSPGPPARASSPTMTWT